MFSLISTCIVLFGCLANLKSATHYKTYRMLHRGTLPRIQQGVRARNWAYVSIITWAISTGTESMCHHSISSVLSAVNCLVDILVLKTREFDDLDPFGSGIKKKLKAGAKKLKTALTPSGSGRSLAPMPI